MAIVAVAIIANVTADYGMKVSDNCAPEMSVGGIGEMLGTMVNVAFLNKVTSRESLVSKQSETY
jgi:multidrug transporter EmrE-like cation transporter